jgi:hypothetical protein
MFFILHNRRYKALALSKCFQHLTCELYILDLILLGFSSDLLVFFPLLWRLYCVVDLKFLLLNSAVASQLG